MATFITTSHGATQSGKLEPGSSATDSYNLWTRDGGAGYLALTHGPMLIDPFDTSLQPVNHPAEADLAFNGPCAAGAELSIGGAGSFVGCLSRRVFVQVSATSPGTLYFETTPDGHTWTESDSAQVIAGANLHGIAEASAGATNYRLRFVCGPSAASEVTLHHYGIN